MPASTELTSNERTTTRNCMVVLRLIVALRGLALTLTLMLSAPVLAAGFTCAQPDQPVSKATLDDLEEVVVTGKEATTRTKDLQAWLRLLVGQYTYEGHVDLCGNGNAEDQRPVTGNADCTGSRSTPTVHCAVNVHWPETRGENGLPVPGGTPNLLPALVTYSLEKRYVQDSGGGEAAFRAALRTGTPSSPGQTSYWGLMFTQLDNRGILEWGSGALIGDTFTASEPCVSFSVPGACRKITRITARPDSNEISMIVDITTDSRRVLRQAFLLHRASDSQNGAQSEASSP